MESGDSKGVYNVKRKIMNRDFFVAVTAKKLGVSVDFLEKGTVVLPCDCGCETCCGWKLEPKEGKYRSDIG